jgi:GT2 family glycosyltransferase
VGAYDAALATRDALFMGGVRYLPAGAADGGWDESELARAGVEHSARQAPRGAAAPPPYDLFWSLSFAVRRRTFLERLGGFDARFTGYGAEDTDFAFTARTAGVPLEWCAGAVAYHQDHEAYDPPLQHLHAIVANAVAFRRKWEVWPMEGWLRAFAEAGYVRWEGAALEVVAEPPPEALAAARRRAFPHG